MSKIGSFASYIAEVGLFTGAGAAAGAIIGGPVGAAGGAVYGATISSMRKPCVWACKKIMNPQTKGEEKLVSLIGTIATNIIGYCAVSLAFTAVGIPIGAFTFTLLGVTTYGLAFAAVAALVGAVALVVLSALAVGGVILGIVYFTGSEETKDKIRHPFIHLDEIAKRSRDKSDDSLPVASAT